MQANLNAAIERRQSGPPVQVIALADDLGLSVYTSLSLGENVSGMIRRDREKGGPSGFAIFVNGSHPEVRRRFTIAHEIAHFILHREKIGDGIVEDALLRASGLTNSIERQANRMAADILMPWSLLDPRLAEGATIEKLASEFKVSRDAMSYRVLGLSYEHAQAAGHM